MKKTKTAKKFNYEFIYLPLIFISFSITILVGLSMIGYFVIKFLDGLSRIDGGGPKASLPEYPIKPMVSIIMFNTLIAIFSFYKVITRK